MALARTVTLLRELVDNGPEVYLAFLPFLAVKSQRSSSLASRGSIFLLFFHSSLCSRRNHHVVLALRKVGGHIRKYLIK